jgi:hypothetical protein
VIAIEGDAGQPEAIMADPRLAPVIDLTEPVCVLLVSMLHFFTASQADMIVDTVRQRIVPGSYLIISQGNTNRGPREGVQGAYGTEITLTGRPDAEIAAYFDGFELLPPGLVPVADWPADEPDARLPSPPPAESASQQANMLGGIGRKRPLTAAHQHRADVELGEPEELLHDVGHALQPYLVHAAHRPAADRVAVQRHDRCGLHGHAVRGRHVHHGRLHGGAAGVRDPLALFQRRVERGQRVRILRRPLLGDHVTLDREARGRALIQVGQGHAALSLLLVTGERFRQHGRADGA